MKKLNKNLPSPDFYVKNIQVLNLFVETKLTAKEMEMLAHFLSLEEVLVKDNMFNTEARKRVREAMGFSNASLANHIASCVSKGFINRHPLTDFLSINQSLLFSKETEYLIKFTKIDD